MSANTYFKRFFKTSAFRTFVCALVATTIRVLYYTNRHDVKIDDAALPYMRGERPAVFAFWHGRLLMMPMMCPPKRKMEVLISNHRDGELIARTMHHFGFGTPRGSSSRGGTSLAMNAVRLIQEGENVSITPDGPRGPAMKVQQGAVSIAQLAGVPVIPVTYSATRYREMRSWDKFMVPLPFGRIIYRVGAPLMNVEPETLEHAMVHLTEQADAAR